MRILVDTSVWVDHLRVADPNLIQLLEEDLVLCHPWVKGELALGSLKDREGFLDMLGLLPMTDVVEAEKTFELIDQRRLYNRGIGWVDAQLLASCRAYPCRLWTKDKRLADLSHELAVGWNSREADGGRP